MAGNLQGDKSGNILTEFDYNNIILVDPNKTYKDGKIQERLVDHEDMVMFANLEAELLPRTKLAIGQSPDNIQIVEIAKMNFLKPKNGKDFTVQYYDEITGLKTTKSQGINQQRQDYIPPINGEKGYFTLQNTVNGQDGTLDTGLLGITSINVKISTSFIPQVEIQLEDVQGKALFQLGEDSPYSAFFHLPYPPFYLTLKGYYGQAIRYQLNLENFNASYNSFSGNYQIKLTLKGYKFNILSEINVGHLLAVPHMYSTRFDISNSPTSEPSSQTLQNAASQQSVSAPVATNSSNSVTQQMVVEKGYQKILEVYAEYKLKKLIEPDFPELTFQQLLDRLERFEQSVIEGYEPKTEVEALTNIREYKKNLESLNGRVLTNTTSFYNKYLNPKPLILKTTEEKIYAFKKEISIEKIPEAVTKLEGDIKTYNDLLNSNPTLGEKGTTPIKNGISINKITGTTTQDSIDWYKTTEKYGFYSPTEAQINKVREDFSYLFDGSVLPGNPIGDAINTLTTNTKPVGQKFTTEENPDKNKDLLKQRFFFFDGVGRFNNVMQDMMAQTEKLLQSYEKSISDNLAKKIEDPNIGLGFKPTPRNIIAVIMASAEAFIRLMDDVHSKAWEVKYDPIRKEAVLNNNIGSDTKNVVPVTNVSSDSSNGQIPVYPWPQVFEESMDTTKGKYQLVYVGDPRIINKTKGYMYDKWPEVEFVEEYLKGFEQRFSSPQSPTPSSIQQFTEFLNINAIEFPNDNVAYQNKDVTKFFYEIWERQFVTSRYEGLGRFQKTNSEFNDIKNLIVDVETKNILFSLGESNPYLNSALKNFKFTSQNFIDFFKSIAPAQASSSYKNFIQDVYNTSYLESVTDSSYSILTTQNIGKIPTTKLDDKKLELIVKSTQTNTPTILDLYPFSNSSWSTNNLVDYSKTSGNQIYNTTKSLKIYKQRNVIANFTDINNYTENRPVTNFSYLDVQNPLSNSNVLTNNNMNGFLPSFYYNRKPKNFLPTEGYFYHVVPTNITSQSNNPVNGLLSNPTTTSILNTPFFVNAINVGIQKHKNNEDYPFRAAAYMFLNSLPLASPKERYKTKGVNLDELDYIFATLKKFGGIHKLPYAWILKIGSVWHRYKNFIDNGTDILDSNTIWKSIDYIKSFDPLTNNQNRTYNLTVNGVSGTTIQLTNTTTGQKIQTGFYPELYNSFYYFYTGNDLFSGYTDNDIQRQLDTNLKVFNFTQSNLNLSQGSTNCSLKTWSALIKNTNNDFFILPSFGSQINEASNAISSNNIIQPNISFSGNVSIFDGSVRCLWVAPNYGYFDVSQTIKPSETQYLNKIDSNAENLSPFIISNQNNYSSIEELFTVFNKNILDTFESEFLNFSTFETKMNVKINSTLKFDESLGDKYVNYRNFQLLFRQFMKINVASSNTDESLFLESINKQYTNFTSIITDFLQYDVIFKYGNPSEYNRKIFDQFLLYNPKSSSVVSANILSAVTLNPDLSVKYKPYVDNSLPQRYSVITNSLITSQNTYPNEWKTLKKYVGFSTIPELVYSNNGSFITDFFIDNNIEFSEKNIIDLAPIIKIYATQKLVDTGIFNNKFKNQIVSYLTNCTDLQNSVIDDILSKLRKDLPNYNEVPEETKPSDLSGNQTKVSLWELFKALNDKWIAGGDYKSKTFYEDFLFLDRASRNIGEIVYLDIFDLKSMLNKKALTVTQDVQVLIQGILVKNNFTVMNLPAYVNFYNAKNVADENPKTDGPNEFADKLWGTYLNVDYRESGPKMIAFYVGKPSNYLDMDKSKNFLFRNDSFQLERLGNPLLEDWSKGKTDTGKSNKCVGFVVDVGIRNQNVFYGFSIDQNPGKATSESIDTLYTMIQQATGRDVATQNVSLWNYYNNRSYSCDIQCMGNALLQPTMYFNLRHVPMFNGAYFITDVSHVITPGDFKTSFNGTRQSLFDLPALDSYIQSINRNLLTQIEKVFLNQNANNKKTSNTINNAGAVPTGGGQTRAAENSCSATTRYNNAGFVSVAAEETAINKNGLADVIKKVIPSNLFLQSVIYSICYTNSSNSNGFSSFNYNYANISLENDWGAFNFKEKKYSCVNINQVSGSKSTPLVNFSDVEELITFLVSRLQPKQRQIENYGLYEFFVTLWPTVANLQWDTIKNTTPYTNIKEKLTKGLEEAKSAGITFNLSDLSQVINGRNATLAPPTPTPSPTPPTPTPSPTPIPRFNQPIFDATTNNLSTNNLNYFKSIILCQYSNFSISNLTQMSYIMTRSGQTIDHYAIPDFVVRSNFLYGNQACNVSTSTPTGIYFSRNDLKDMLDSYSDEDYTIPGTITTFNLKLVGTAPNLYYRETYTLSLTY